MKRVNLILAIIMSISLTTFAQQKITTGAERLNVYLPLLEGKKVGVMVNQTAIVGGKHLVDVLLEKGVDLQFAFIPEHGFRGTIERGEDVHNDVDTKTGLPLYSLYGENHQADSLVRSVDVMIFDIQDVGARFYTFVVGMHNVMQLCANNNRPLLVLDRPNPNGEQVDGPVRKDDKFKSDISFHKVAMIHGLTIGELAQMINGEGWLDNGEKKCDLTVIPLENYTHKSKYELPVIPSPSLPNYQSVRLFPLLCLFEATDFSIGRGTDFPFQVIGYPDTQFGDFTFTPGTRVGMSAHVEQQGNLCYGIDLRGLKADSIRFTLKYILDFYHKMPDKFFARPDFFDKLAGTDKLREQILAGWTEEQIRDSWKEELSEYKRMRKKYLLYEDFE
ncbi:DUF1343 domain-containing protein [Maribellus sp. CM-23]|uniref:exo-beta-N-acetylmuramidase NamZ family protein n=1 Tax=Maribellus sp. CM-23 TaxID=2781026 RepID=UPI001F29DE29|nr:DUF1343 domain-containing protein [Maribellus sp. CM-23]MCE4563826.1 DUF1343 domain-containing protein [Maribellus sp. CM-23]